MRIMIMHMCSRCGRQLPAGQRCNCQPAYRRDYNRFRRDKKIKEFRATSPEWARARSAAIARDHGLDRYLLHTTGEMRRGVSVHHILPLSTPEGWARRADVDNLICLSEATHSSIEYRYKGAQREALQRELFAIIREPVDGELD